MDIGNTLPQFDLEATSETRVSPESLAGKYAVIYFYPKDSTPGCTTEGLEFAELFEEYQQANCDIYGVSRDSIKSHENFKAKQGFPFELICDKEEVLCKIFDVIKEKNMYGKKVMGIERSTFLIDPDGKVIHVWRKVKAQGHAAAVLDVLKEA